MKGYFKSLIGLFWEKDISILYFIFGALMFVSAIVQVDDPTGKVEPAIENPTMIVWTCVIIGFLSMVISPIGKWFILRNMMMGFNFFLSIYVIVDCGEAITNSSNSVWLVAMCVFAGLFARSYKDLLQDKERYVKPGKDKNEC